MSVAEAQWLGAAYGATILEIELACGNVLNAHALRTTARLDESTFCSHLSDADVAFLRGVLAHNPHTTETSAHALLCVCHKRHAVPTRKTLPSAAARRVFAQAVFEMQTELQYGAVPGAGQ